MSILKYLLNLLLAASIISFECHNVNKCEQCTLFNQCIQCMTGYKKVFSQYQIFCCPENCKRCQLFTSTCQICQQQFLVVPQTGTCKKQTQSKNTNSSYQNDDDSDNQHDDQDNSSEYKKQNYRSMSQKIGVIIGTFVAFVVLTFIIWIIYKKCKNPQNNSFRQNRATNNLHPVIIPTGLSSEYQIPRPRQNSVVSQSLGSQQYISTQFPEGNVPGNNQPSLYRNRDVCAVCLCDQTNIRTTCTHQFHSQCIVAWCKKKYVCPDCNNSQFQLIAMCQKCKQFKKLVKLCRSNCRETNHFQCFKRQNGRKLVCKDCID